MFDWEQGIALNTMHGFWASSHGEGEFSWFFSRCGENLGYILEFWRGWPFTTHVCSATSRLLSSYQGQLRNLHEAWQGNVDAFHGEAGDQGSLSSCHSDFGIPSNFQQESAIVIFLGIELCVPLEVSKGCDASGPDDSGTYGIL